MSRERSIDSFFNYNNSPYNELDEESTSENNYNKPTLLRPISKKDLVDTF